MSFTKAFSRPKMLDTFLNTFWLHKKTAERHGFNVSEPFAQVIFLATFKTVSFCCYILNNPWEIASFLT
jgi:hypothetical protein